MKTIICICISLVVGVVAGFWGRKLYFEAEILEKQNQFQIEVAPDRIEENTIQNQLIFKITDSLDMVDEYYWDDFYPV